MAGKVSGKGSDNVETPGWLQPASVPLKAEHKNYRQGWEQMRFSRLLWEFGSLCDLWKGFVPAVINVRVTSHIWNLTVLLQLFLGKLDVRADRGQVRVI